MGHRVLSFLSLWLILSPLAQGDWPAWTSYKTHLIGPEGRVIDASDPRRITTSEGQSYALFFALVADDRETFARVLDWTQNQLVPGDLGAALPAWLWGRRENDEFGILDPNSASDADLWMAYSLLEAGRLWGRRDYQVIGNGLARRIAEQEVVEVPGLGALLLPGRYGFHGDGLWRFNPSYVPPQLIARLAERGSPWMELQRALPGWLMATAPLGLAPDWAAWEPDKGWGPDPVHGTLGDYDAIRVYLWLGMLAEGAPDRVKLMAHFAPMRCFVAQRGTPPEQVDAATGEAFGTGNSGFSAALLPFLTGTPMLAPQRQRLATHLPDATAYYNQSLRLFGQGWDEGRYRFSAKGRLIPAWGTP